MSVCTSCYNAGIYIDNCALGIQFGTVAADTDYLVCVQHNGTGRIQTFEVTSDGDGNVLIENVKLDPLQGYTIWVTEDAPNSDRVTITIDTTEYKCIDFAVVRSDADPQIVVL